MNLFKHLAVAAADSIETGLRSIGWGQPTAPTAWETGLVEAEAEEEVHLPRCSCLSPARVDELVDTAIDTLNDLLRNFNPRNDTTGVVVPSPALTGLEAKLAAAKLIDRWLSTGALGECVDRAYWNNVAIRLSDKYAT